MTKRTIETDHAKELININKTPNIGTYISTFLNQINQWAGGSKAENVGQVSELIKTFRKEKPTGTLDEWKKYHKGLTGKDITILKGKGNNKVEAQVKMAGIEQGITDIMRKLKEVEQSISKVTEDDIRKWLENLTYEKTFCGLTAQELILKDIAVVKSCEYCLGTADDEKKGIDGYIIINGKRYPLQIKSESYRNKNKQETFTCPIVYYKLKKNGIEYDFDDNKLK